jgi:Carboxypeptidase regulatory-like domain
VKIGPQFVGQAPGLPTGWLCGAGCQSGCQSADRMLSGPPAAGRLSFFTGLVFVFAAWSVSVSAQTGPDALSVSGAVSDATGAAIAGAEVTLNRDGSQHRTASTDNSGNFRFIAVPAGHYEILVRRDGFTPASLPLTIADHSPAPCILRCS